MGRGKCNSIIACCLHGIRNNSPICSNEPTTLSSSDAYSLLFPVRVVILERMNELEDKKKTKCKTRKAERNKKEMMKN